MSSIELMELIKKELYKETSKFVVYTDNIKEKPKLPFYSIKMTTLRQGVGEEGNQLHEFVESKDSAFKWDYLEVLQSQPNAIISLMAYDKDMIGAMKTAYEAFNFFKFSGRRIFKEKGFVIVDVGDVQDRTVLNVDNYEYRYGFDLKVRYVEEIVSRVENIEEYKIKKGERK